MSELRSSDTLERVRRGGGLGKRPEAVAESNPAPRRRPSALALVVETLTQRQSLPICGTALGMGTLYGVVTATLCISLVIFLKNAMGEAGGPPPIAAPVLGLVTGALGGAVAGVAGTFVRRVRACVLAGMAAGLSPILVMTILTLLSGDWSGKPPDVELQILALVPVLTGGLLGLAVGRGLQSGHSAVPGVQSLVEKMQRADAMAPPCSHPALPAEVTPAAMPPGRGDEASPALPG